MCIELCAVTQSDTARYGKFCEGGLVHVWWGFVAESGHQSDTCVLLSFVRVVWYVCGYPFLAKCSFRSDLSFMSVCMCVLGCAPSLASIYSSLLTHYFSLGIHSCIVYILLLADSLYPFLHSAPSYILCSSL